jgi:AraC family transcriptional regulator of adaptative response / DNA-3-methyladenine glycosylase II
LQKALGVREARHPAKEAQAASQAWRPWRSYAVIRAWAAAPATPHRMKKDAINSNSNKPI